MAENTFGAVRQFLELAALVVMILCWIWSTRERIRIERETAIAQARQRVESSARFNELKSHYDRVVKQLKAKGYYDSDEAA